MRALVFTALCVACAGAFSAGRPGLHGARRRAAPPAPRARVAEGAALRARPVLSSAAAGSGGENKWYRTLGIAPDATYDEVTDAFTALVEAAGSDEARVELLERARDRILDARLKLRLSGQGQTVREPTRAPKARRDWLAPLRFLGKYVAMPDRRHFSKVTTVFGGFTAIALAGSQLADQMAFFTMVFAPGFIYANGQPEPRKDDNGMVRGARAERSAVGGAQSSARRAGPWAGAAQPAELIASSCRPFAPPLSLRWARSCRPSPDRSRSRSP